MKLGIIGAMAVEVETLKEAMESLQVSHRCGMEFFDGKLCGLDAVVVQSGVGKVNAALCVQVLADCCGVTHVLNTGIAGSLCAELDIGDLVVSRDAMYHDMDVRVFGYPAGQVPGTESPQFSADPMLIEQAQAAAERIHAGHVRIGRVASGDQFICTPEQKEAIISLTGALCTEMEGAAIAHAAWKNHLPFVIIRAISDKADNSAEMDYPTFEAQAAQHCARVTMMVAARLAETNEEKSAAVLPAIHK